VGVNVDAFVKETDDIDLDALMNRVREAALGMGAGGSATAPAQTGETITSNSDLIRVIEAQSQWNEQTRKALTEIVQCFVALRDDWAEAQKGLRQEIDQLSGLVRQLRTTLESSAAGPKPPAAAARGRRAIASPRRDKVRRATKGGKQRS